MPERKPGLTDDLAEELSRLLVTTVLEGSSDDERADIQALPSPDISTRVDDGKSWLVVDWGGRNIAFEWDGSTADASEILRSVGPDLADSLSTDYWVNGGWRNHRGHDGGYLSG